MIRIEIQEAESGRRIDRFLKILLPKAPVSFLHRALRENKIKINRKKPKSLSEPLCFPGVLELYFTDTQLQDFGWKEARNRSEDFSASREKDNKSRSLCSAKTASGKSTASHQDYIKVLFEDSRLLIVDKPSGITVQKGASDPVSLTEMALAYLSDRGERFSLTYRPSFCHRLDKNTRGVLVMAKTLEAHHAIDAMLQSRTLKKYYLGIVSGNPSCWDQETLLRHLYTKDRQHNMAHLRPYPATGAPEKTDSEKPAVVSCLVRKICALPDGRNSLVRVELLSGKSHQIRAQLSFEGYPLAGDPKYASGPASKDGQMLLAYELFFEEPPAYLKDLKGKHVYASIPETWPLSHADRPYG